MGACTMLGWDAGAKVWRKILVNSEGKLIIDPSEILENPPTPGETAKAPQSAWAAAHAGDAAAHHARYTDAEAIAAVGYSGTKYWSCAGVHFDALHPDTANLLKYNNGRITIGSTTTYLTAAVFLPHGCTVTEAVVKGNAAAAAKMWQLFRVRLSDGATNQMAINNINTVATSISYSLVGNYVYAYILITDTLATNDAIYGAYVKYTI
jgi:hypothetical protein